MKQLRIAAFGIRSLPPEEGSAGADKFALELYSRLVDRGHLVTAYTRIYTRGGKKIEETYNGIRIIKLSTTTKAGFDSFVHSFKATYHILKNNTADVVHIHNGGNSFWGIFIRIFGKKVIVAQDGIDWKREKWSWYGKLYLYLSAYITANVPNAVVFDNIYAKEMFEKKFKRKFYFIPYGSELKDEIKDSGILKKLGLTEKEYFLFVGRFIPDKGLQYLIPAFEKVNTTKKLVLVGGSPNPSDFEKSIKSTSDTRIIFPGYIYGDDVNALMKNAYAYIQPSDVEGLSPVILTVMGLGTPLICSNIKENIYAVADTAVLFEKGNILSLKEKIEYALHNYDELMKLSTKAKQRTKENFSWERHCNQHIDLFSQTLQKG